MQRSPDELIAIQKYYKGEQYSVSTSIDDDTILAGYGKLNYEFEYPLPRDIVYKIYGTTSWRVWSERIQKSERRKNIIDNL